MKKIAFCFLIYDIINFEEYWHNFFKDIDPNKYSIFIHYKIDVPLKYLEKYKLDRCIDTKYGGVSLVHAQNKMLREAYKDKNNYKFVFVSQSCIPLKRFDYVYNFLTTDNLGYFNFFEVKPEFIKYNKLIKNINSNHLHKAAQWAILNREITEIVKYDSVTKYFEDIFASDEYAYITKIFEKRLDDQIHITYRSADGATTFSNRSHWLNYKYKNPSGLKNYELISKEELTHIVKSPCLFGRKFEIPNSRKVERYISLRKKLDELKEVGTNLFNIRMYEEELQTKFKDFTLNEKLFKLEDIYLETMNELW